MGGCVDGCVGGCVGGCAGDHLKRAHILAALRSTFKSLISSWSTCKKKKKN